MRTAHRMLAALAGAGLVLAPVAAHADDISNSVDSSVDAVAETMPLNVGGSAGNTGLYVIARNGDGKNGCNLTGGTSLSLAIASSSPAVATVSPSSITFTSCEDRKAVTITPHAVGSTTITATQTGNTTGASFNLAPVTFTVTVAPPANTAPTVAVRGVEEGAQYAKGNVPAAGCQADDAEDGTSQFAAQVGAITGPHDTDGIGQQTATCSYTDGGGLTASSAVTYTIVDPTAPEIAANRTPATPDGENGWYRGDVTLGWTVTEPESPNSLETTGCGEVTVDTDQDERSYTCEATSAGGTDSRTVVIKRDATAPTVSLVGGPADGESYLRNSVPAVPVCAAADATSGLAGACVVAGYGTGLGNHTVTATATDRAGNTAATSIRYGVHTLTLSGFSQPVDTAGGVVNTVKGGSTVPLKFRVFNQGVEQTSTAIVKSFKQERVTCLSGAVEDAVEVVTTGATTLRYEAGQFVQNWKTPTGAGACYAVTLTTVDDSVLKASFKLK